MCTVRVAVVWYGEGACVVRVALFLSVSRGRAVMLNMVG